MFPDFIVVGAPKCGSSSLYTLLKQHPDLCMSTYKEPYLYLRDWGKSPSYYKDKYFPNCNGDKIVGEATTDYMFFPEVAKRIFQVKPNTKFLFILRNPVDRAFSHYWQSVKSGKQINSWEYLITNSLSHETFSYSFYYFHLKRFVMNNFNGSQVHVIIFEEFIKNPDKEYQKVCEFLNVEVMNIPTLPFENKGVTFRNNWIRAGVMKIKNSRNLYLKTPSFLIPAGKKILDFLNYINTKSMPSNLNQLESSRSFLNQYYREDVRNLEKLLQRKLPWNLD